MRGSKAKRLRREAWHLAFTQTADATQTVAPHLMGDLPVRSLLRDSQTGALISPPHAGRFWYKRLKGQPLGEVRERSLKVLQS